MNGIVIKKGNSRKITHPTDDPLWERKQRIAGKRLREGKMKFLNEADERDYNRRVNASKFNVRGLPAFYPADHIRSLCVSDIPRPTKEQIESMKVEEARIASIKDVDLFCTRCDKITSHSVSPDQAFCHDCGKQRPDYAEQYTEIINDISKNKE